MANMTSEAFVAHNNNLKTFSLIWLDAYVKTTPGNDRVRKKLHDIISHIKTFDDPDKCQQHISAFSEQDRIVLIISGRLGRELVPQIHQLRQISSIYVYCVNKQFHKEWTKKFSKVKSVIIHCNDLIRQIKLDRENRMKLEETLSISTFTVNNHSDQSMTEINGQFVHSCRLIDILLRIKSNPADRQQLIKILENEYQGNDYQLAMIQEFADDYRTNDALWWYTRESFLYKILNKALRTQNIDLLFLFRFIISDIYQQLKENQCSSPIQVYRTQLMSSDELNTLQRSINKYISINSFFSCTIDRTIALFMLGDLNVSIDMERILFIIDADPSIATNKSFADISTFSEFINEGEVLFMTKCIFQLIDIRREENIWVIQLRLCGNDENDLMHLFQYMKEEYGGDHKEVNALSFSEILCEMGKYELAEEINYRLLDELPLNDPSLSNLYYSLGEITIHKSEYETSLQWFHKSLEITYQTNPLNSIKIGKIYNGIGVLHWKKGDEYKALECYNKAIELFQQADAENHVYMGSFYNNIAVIYGYQKKYSEALNFYEKSLTIYENQLRSDHLEIAGCYSNIGVVHQNLGQYDLAIEYHHRALKIRSKSLPIHHPSVALTYKNIGFVHEKKGEWQQALTYYEKATTIYGHSLSSQHPCIMEMERSIQRVAVELK